MNQRPEHRPAPRPSPPAAPEQEPRDGDGDARVPRSATAALGESLAAAFLAARGFVVHARDLRTTCGEIDLLVRRKRVWVAVEVKTRRRHEAPERCVSPAQHARLVRALSALAGVLRPRPVELRVDVVAVRLPHEGDPELRHFEGRPFAPPRG